MWNRILVGAQSLPKVVIGYLAISIASIQLFIAQEKGFFRDAEIAKIPDQRRLSTFSLQHEVNNELGIK